MPVFALLAHAGARMSSTTTTPVLRDPERDAQLRDEGFSVMPLLSADEVAEVRSAYRALVADPDAPGDMAFDYMAEDRSAMRVVADLLQPVWDRHLPEVFVDYDWVFSTFVAKHPGPVSGMFLHDDRTYLDERRQRAFTIWVPLVDTSPELDNGTLWIVPGSHHIMAAFSGTGTPDWIRPYEHYIERFLRPLTMTAGQALVYDTKTLHGSTANRTSETREAIATAVAPRGAELIHVVAEGDQRKVYRIDRDFFIDVHPHAIAETGMPERYPLIEAFTETLLEVDPRAIAAACDPNEVPEPEVLPVAQAPRPIEPPGERERAAARQAELGATPTEAAAGGSPEAAETAQTVDVVEKRRWGRRRRT